MEAFRDWSTRICVQLNTKDFIRSRPPHQFSKYPSFSEVGSKAETDVGILHVLTATGNAGLKKESEETQTHSKVIKVIVYIHIK